jgi:hypothetical protein
MTGLLQEIVIASARILLHCEIDYGIPYAVIATAFGPNGTRSMVGGRKN